MTAGEARYNTQVRMLDKGMGLGGSMEWTILTRNDRGEKSGWGTTFGGMDGVTKLNDKKNER